MSDDLQGRLASLREAEVPVPALAAVRDRARRRRRAGRVATVVSSAVVAVSVATAVTLAGSGHGASHPATTTGPSVPLVSSTPVTPPPSGSSVVALTAVPDVRGMSEVDATGVLKQLGFLVSMRTSASSVTAGTVVTQAPAAGSLVAPATTVSLVVAAPANSGGATLPDGSALPAGCTLPPTQSDTPAPDDVIVAGDSCAFGEFSITTGRVMRYLGQTNMMWLDPDGGVWFGGYGCNSAVMELKPGTQIPTVVSPAASGSEWPIAVGRGRAAWAVGPCDTAGATGPARMTSITVRDTVSRSLVWQHGAGAITAGAAALSNDGRLAVAFSRIDGTTRCPAGGDSCPNILTEGISIVSANASTIPDPQIVAAARCSFGELAWSGADVLAVEQCPISNDPQYDDRRINRLVRLDPTNGKRLATIELPSGYPAVDRVDGMRTLSNGDVLVAMGSAKVGGHIDRVHGDIATPVDMHGIHTAQTP